MKPVSDFQRLKDEWYLKARESGFSDIESPSGDIARRAVPETRLAEVAELEAARAFLHSHTFADDFERRVWELHAEGASNRAIQRLLKLGTRKRVDAAILRLTATMRGEAGRRKGRPRDPDSLRGEGVGLFVRLSQAHLLAVDRIRVFLGCTPPEAARRALLEYARKVSSGYPKRRGQ